MQKLEKQIYRTVRPHLTKEEARYFAINLAKLIRKGRQ